MTFSQDLIKSAKDHRCIPNTDGKPFWASADPAKTFRAQHLCAGNAELETAVTQKISTLTTEESKMQLWKRFNSMPFYPELIDLYKSLEPYGILTQQVTYNESLNFLSIVEVLTLHDYYVSQGQNQFLDFAYTHVGDGGDGGDVGDGLDYENIIHRIFMIAKTDTYDKFIVAQHTLENMDGVHARLLHYEADLVKEKIIDFEIIGIGIINLPKKYILDLDLQLGCDNVVLGDTKLGEIHMCRICGTNDLFIAVINGKRIVGKNSNSELQQFQTIPNIVKGKTLCDFVIYLPADYKISPKQHYVKLLNDQIANSILFKREVKTILEGLPQFDFRQFWERDLCYDYDSY